MAEYLFTPEDLARGHPSFWWSRARIRAWAEAKERHHRARRGVAPGPARDVQSRDSLREGPALPVERSQSAEPHQSIEPSEHDEVVRHLQTGRIRILRHQVVGIG